MQVWDLSTQQCKHTLRHHTGKVQVVAWNPAEAPVLLSGAFDRSVCLVRNTPLFKSTALKHLSSVQLQAAGTGTHKRLRR